MLLLVVLIALLFAMTRSLKSLRRNVANGTFAAGAEVDGKPVGGNSVSGQVEETPPTSPKCQGGASA